jgi:hypothetical protein
MPRGLLQTRGFSLNFSLKALGGGGWGVVDEKLHVLLISTLMEFSV